MIKKLIFFVSMLTATFSSLAQEGGCTPTVNFNGSSTVNHNATYTYTVSVSGGSIESTEYVVSGGTLGTQTNTSVQVTWTSTGNHWIRAIVEVCGNFYTRTHNVTVAVSPSAITPAALEEISNTTTSFQSRWTSVPDATKYRLDVSTSSSFGSFISGYNNLDVGLNIQRTVSGLTPGLNYYYRLRAEVGGVTSLNSNVITAHTTIAAPTNLQSSSATGTSFQASWLAASGASSYQLDVSTSSSFSSYVSGYQNKSVTGTSHSITGLAPGTIYYFRLRSVGSASTSGNSLNSTGTTILDAPTATVESNVTNSAFRANWTIVGGASFLSAGRF